MLFRHSPGGVSISWSVVLSTVGTLAALAAVLIAIAARAMGRRPKTGAEGLIGQAGTAETELAPAGRVSLGGELWKAVSLDGTLPAGTAVKVESTEGLTLRVRRKAG